MGGGLQRICRWYGSMVVKDNNGKSVRWLWDYVNDKARLESEMTKEEIAASEKAKWEGVKKELDKNKNNENEKNNIQPPF